MANNITSLITLKDFLGGDSGSSRSENDDDDDDDDDYDNCNLPVIC